MDPGPGPGGPKHGDPADPDPDPQHCIVGIFLEELLIRTPYSTQPGWSLENAMQVLGQLH
jgi:hypothetical protein